MFLGRDFPNITYKEAFYLLFCNELYNIVCNWSLRQCGGRGNQSDHKGENKVKDKSIYQSSKRSKYN